MNEQYKSYHENFQSIVDSLKSNLINLVKKECKTYSEIDRFLSLREKEAIWEKDLVLLVVIKQVSVYFDEEKGGLSVK